MFGSRKSTVHKNAVHMNPVHTNPVHTNPVYRTMLKSKIHRATVTQADLHYVGSVTIDAALMDAADLLPGEQVTIVDIANGARLETYVIEGERGSGVIGINGAAAHLVQPGDLVILISYQLVDDRTARTLEPRIVHVDAGNRIVDLDADPARPVPGSDTLRPPLAAARVQGHPSRSPVTRVLSHVVGADNADVTT